jgi:hypothetical protein
VQELQETAFRTLSGRQQGPHSRHRYAKLAQTAFATAANGRKEPKVTDVEMQLAPSLSVSIKPRTDHGTLLPIPTTADQALCR